MSKRYLICLILFGLFGCSQETAITKKTEAQNRNVSDNPSATVPAKVETTVKTAEAPVKVIGDFSNIKTDGEHESGYSAALWQQDDQVYGLISGGDDLRLIGDPPTGLLEDVRYDPKTKKLSFRAKMPGPSVYEFEGTLEAENLTGNIKVTDALCGAKCPGPKKVTLLRSKDLSSAMTGYQSSAEWKTGTDKILNRKGSK